MPERTPETSSPTSPSHPARTIRVPDQVRGSQSALATRSRATSHRTAEPATVQTQRAHRSTCRNPRLFRTAPHSASSIRTLDRTDTTPCTARRELARVLESPVRSSAAVRSQALLLPILAILRRSDEHLHEVVVQRVVKLPLKAPLKLRIVKVPRMQIKVIRVNRHTLILELDDDLHAITLGARREVQ